MQCIEVLSKADIDLFHSVAAMIYALDKNYIPHLIEDIENIFKDNKGASLAKRWVMLVNGKPVGRIAAFTTKFQNTGGLGFFECINDKSISHLLFQTGINWLKTKGIDKIQAPINYGERDKYWGLLIEGFSANSYQENYNPMYYKQLIEDFGFVSDFNQTTYRIEKDIFDAARIARLYTRVKMNENFQFKHFENKNRNQFAHDFASVYNQAWQQNEDFLQLDAERVMDLFKEMKSVIQENLIWMAYENKKPIGFFINILEINYALKELNGKKSIVGGLKYMLKRKMNPPNTTRGIVFGIVPAYQNKGIDVGLIYHFHQMVLRDTNIQYCILSWIGDFNDKMNSLMKALGADTYKTHATYTLNS